jgi:hypothetical protein
MVLLFSAGFWIAVSERETPSARVARTIPRNRFLRGMAFLLYTGAAGGVAWSVVMIALTLAVAVACTSLFPVSTAAGYDYYALGERIEIMGGMGLYAYCYAISAVLIRRKFLAGKTRYSQTWTVALCLLALGSFFPLLVAYIASPARFDITVDALGLWTAANPFFLGNDITRSTHLTFAAVWAIAVTLLASPWFVRQVRNFRPPGPRREPEGAADDKQQTADREQDAGRRVEGGGATNG